jgi:sucrose-6-phosphate hydrolase SacC (GH32 family)
LKEWKVKSQTEGYFECPDLFELPLDGDAAKKKWVLTAANHEYKVGSFDGTNFTPETGMLPGHRGKGFYAAQTFSDIPAKDGRRIQIGWLQAPAPGMPFNQAMTVPLEVKLVSTKDGPRLTWTPVRELETQRGKAIKKTALTLNPGEKNPLAEVTGEMLDLVAVVEPGKATELAFMVRGVPVVYDVAKQELLVNGHKAPAPLRDGKLDLRILTDRTAFEVFASGGLTYMPIPVIPKAQNRTIAVAVKGGPAIFHNLDVYEIKSIWSDSAAARSK